MKQQMRKLFFPALTGFIFLFTLQACEPSKEAAGSQSSPEIVAVINNNAWIFTAQNVTPQTGRTRIVNGVYTFACGKEKLVSYLPYFGRAFSGVALLNTQGPLDFTSTDFSLSKEQNKKGAWIITIKPRDSREVSMMIFTLYENGSAQLSVTLTNRTPISFTGNIAEVK